MIVEILCFCGCVEIFRLDAGTRCQLGNSGEALHYLILSHLVSIEAASEFDLFILKSIVIIFTPASPWIAMIKNGPVLR